MRGIFSATKGPLSCPAVLASIIAARHPKMHTDALLALHTFCKDVTSSEIDGCIVLSSTCCWSAHCCLFDWPQTTHRGCSTLESPRQQLSVMTHVTSSHALQSMAGDRCALVGGAGCAREAHQDTAALARDSPRAISCDQDLPRQDDARRAALGRCALVDIVWWLTGKALAVLVCS